MHHAVNAGKGRAVTFVGVGIKLLLCEDITTVLLLARVSHCEVIPY